LRRVATDSSRASHLFTFDNEAGTALADPTGLSDLGAEFFITMSE
jgi:hypothetical protein